MAMDLSLLPNQAKFQASKIKLKERISLFNWIFSFIWLASVLVVLIFWLSVKTRLILADRNYQKANDQYKTMSSDLLINQQIKFDAKLVGKILSERFEYGKSLQEIGGLFSSNVVLEDFKLNDNKTFVLSGTTSNNQGIDEVEKKINDINAGLTEKLTEAKLTSLFLDGNNWKFELEVKVK